MRCHPVWGNRIIVYTVPRNQDQFFGAYPVYSHTSRRTAANNQARILLILGELDGVGCLQFFYDFIHQLLTVYPGIASAAVFDLDSHRGYDRVESMLFPRPNPHLDFL